MLATIDVGSNTVRMLLGHIQHGDLIPVRYERAITRLGGHFNPETGLAEDSMERTLAALRSFSEILAKTPILKIRSVGTAALRRAVNREDFILKVTEETGLILEVIDGKKEAQLSALGVLEALDPQPQSTLIIDIGGGSTEFVLLAKGNLLFRESYPLGVVRLCEDHADETARNHVITDILSQFETSLSKVGLLDMVGSDDCEFVGTAGTITTLAAMDLRMDNYDWSRINNYLLPVETLEKQSTDLSKLTISQREELPGLEAGRGDLIMPGIQILRDLANRFQRPHFRVSDFGLLEGILLDLANSSSD